jgi:hypothetical protein
MADVHTLIDAGLVSYRQIDYWLRRGWLSHGDPTPGSGHQRDWSDEELRVARRMALLVNRAGMLPAVAAEVARRDGSVELAPGVLLQMSEVA